MSDILSIGTSATQLYQKAISTVSNNVANLNSEGYSRQEAISAENYPTQYGVNYLGSGAFLESVRRNYDQFLERNLRNSLNDVSTNKPLVSYTSRLLDVVSSEKNALSPAFDRFFNVVEKLSLEPDSMPLRADLLSSADFLAGRIRHLNQTLDDIDQESARDMQTNIDTVNSLSKQLAGINRQLQKNSKLERQPAALLDQRDRLLKDLSSLVNIRVTESVNGQLEIGLMDSGENSLLVSGENTWKLTSDFVTARPGTQYLFLDGGGSKSGISLSGGELAGLSTFRADVLAPLMSQLNILAEGFVNEINVVHREGLTLDNQIGSDMFSVARNFSASDTSGREILSVQITEGDIRDQEYKLSVTWLGGNEWQVIDHSNDTSVLATGSSQGDELLLSFGNLSIRYQELPLRGEPVIIQSTRQAAQGITLALSDVRHIAASKQYEVSQSSSNSEAIELTLAVVQPAVNEKLKNVLSLDEFQGKNLSTTVIASDINPAIRVPGGMSEFLIAFQPKVGSDMQLQVFTEDFNHLLGKDLSNEANTLLDMKLSAFETDSQYIGANRSDASTGSFSYREAQFFYGHKANTFTQSGAIPAIAHLAGTNIIDEGDLVLNGISLPALSIAEGETLTAQHIVDWVNGSNTGVKAELVTVPVTDLFGNVSVDPETGKELFQNVVRFSSDSVAFSFGKNGKPADLSVLGLSTGLYASGVIKEDLLIYAGENSNEAGAWQVTELNLDVKSKPDTSNSPGLNEAMKVVFHKEEGKPLLYEIIDANGVSLALREFDLTQGVKAQGFSLDFNKTPVDGDSFVIEPNRNASGDNRNLLSLISLRSEKTVNQQNFQDYYLGMTNTIGNVQKISSMNLEASEIVYDEAVAKEAQVSGVNLDQEAADLIRFQQAYQAAAQVIQTAIKLFDTLLSSSR